MYNILLKTTFLNPAYSCAINLIFHRIIMCTTQLPLYLPPARPVPMEIIAIVQQNRRWRPTRIYQHNVKDGKTSLKVLTEINLQLYHFFLYIFSGKV